MSGPSKRAHGHRTAERASRKLLTITVFCLSRPGYVKQVGDGNDPIRSGGAGGSARSVHSELDALRESRGGVADLTKQFGSCATDDRAGPQKTSPVEIERGNSAKSVQQIKKYREAKASLEASSPSASSGSQRGPPPKIDLYQ